MSIRRTISNPLDYNSKVSFFNKCRLPQIEKTRTTPYHPKSDGLVERFNSTMAKMLTAYVDEYHSNWDTLLPFVTMAYMSAIHETSGCTRNRVMLWRKVATPVDIMYNISDYGSLCLRTNVFRNCKNR